MPLSSVVTNREMIGYKGAELLDHLMGGGKAPSIPLRIKPGGVIVRQSSDIVAVSDEHLIKAMDYIARNIAHAMTVDDVVTAAGTSRRSLYNKFAAEVGHSVQREITRQRLERAMHLMREEGNEKLQTIAEWCGFECSDQLSKVFKHHLGFSVSQFRQQNRQPKVG